MKKQIVMTGIALLTALLSACGTVTTYSKIMYREKNSRLTVDEKVAIFPAFARSGVKYAKRKLETILRYHLLLKKESLGWRMTFPDKVKQTILDVKADDLYLIIYHKYNALSHFAAQDLVAIGKKLGVSRILIPEMVQESVKSGPYWLSKNGASWNLTTLYDDYYVRIVLQIFDVAKGKFICKTGAVTRVKKRLFIKDNQEESLGKAYSAAIEKMLAILIGKNK